VCGTNEAKPLGSGCNINFLHPTLLPLFLPYVAVQIKMVTRLILTEFILMVPVAWGLGSRTICFFLLSMLWFKTEDLFCTLQ
jgi:hypothetical protein